MKRKAEEDGDTAIASPATQGEKRRKKHKKNKKEKREKEQAAASRLVEGPGPVIPAAAIATARPDTGVHALLS